MNECRLRDVPRQIRLLFEAAPFAVKPTPAAPLCYPFKRYVKIKN
jgi:hypothetical protein